MRKNYEKPETTIVEIEFDTMLDMIAVSGTTDELDAAQRIDADDIMDIQDAFEGINKSVGLSIWE